MKYPILLAIFLLGNLGAAELREYPFYRELSPAGNAEKSAVVVLDETFYKHLNDDYSNVLLLDSDGNTVPFARRYRRDQATIHDWEKKAGKITGFTRDHRQNTATLEFELDTPQRISRMSFLTSDKRFNKKIDLRFEEKSGAVRQESATLYKYEDIYGAAHVDFPAVEVKKFTAVIHDFEERREGDFSTEISGTDGQSVQKTVRKGEFGLKGVSVFEQTTRHVWQEPHVMPVSLPELRRENRKGRTIITVDACRVPCSKLTLETEEPHFSRTVEIHADKELLASKTISAGNTEIELPQFRADSYTVTIINNDNTPLKNLTLQWECKKQILIFIPPTAGELRVYYGGNAPGHLYDIENYADHFTAFPEYTAGKESANPAWNPAFSTGKFLTVAMWAVLIAAAALLGTVIFKLFRAVPAEK